MTLEELYDEQKVKKNRIVGGKRFLLLTPSREYDCLPFIEEFLLDETLYEITFPKGLSKKAEYDILMAEIEESCSEMCIQIDCNYSKKLPFWTKDRCSKDLPERILSFRGDAFVDLHRHDEFSIRDGLGTMEDYILLLQSRDQTVCTVTNHGTVGGWIKQYNVCKKHGIKSIFGCLLPGQPIITKNGVKRIEDVCIGDEVLTHKGRFRKVITNSERNYDGKIYSPNCWGLDDCWTTDEHPFLMYCLSNDDMNKDVKSGPNGGYSWKYDFDWIRADKLKTRKIYRGNKNKEIPVKGRWSHYAVAPRCNFKSDNIINVLDALGYEYTEKDSYVSRIKKHSRDTCKERHNIPAKIILDEDWMRFFGLFIAEGSTAHGVVRLTFNLFSDIDAIEFVRSFVYEKFGQELTFAGYSKNGEDISKAGDFYFCSVIFQKLLDSLFGHGAKNKKFPIVWLGLEYKFLWSLLDGIWEGDGHKKNDCLKTSSWELVQLCRQAIINLDGNSYAVVKIISDDKIGYDLGWRRHKKSCYTDFDEYNSYLPVRDIKTKNYDGKVYNLEVEEDNSYVSGVAVHNCELYVNDYRGDDFDERKKHRKNNHLCVWAKNEEGFYNIIKLHNDAQTEGYYYLPRCDYAHLKEWGAGIAASSACFSGEISQALVNDDFEKAKKAYDFYSDAFDEFYIELTMIDWAEQISLNKKLIEFAHKVGAPMIVTLDSHYLYAEYAETHDLLMLIRTGKTTLDKIEKPDEQWQFAVKSLFSRTEQQVREMWSDLYKDDIFTEEVFEEAVKNTRRIVMKCDNINLDSTVRLPKLYPDANQELRDRAKAGLCKKGLDGVVGYDERLDFELDVITKMGYADYFLVVEKIVIDTKEKFGDMSVGWGRGCFTPDTRVITESGIPKFIDDVEVGDKVIADDKSIQTVEQTFEYDVDEELFEIEVDDGRIFKCTKDHGIFINVDGKIVEKKAKDLKEGDDILEVA